MHTVIYAVFVTAMLVHILSGLVVGYVELFRRPELWASGFRGGRAAWLLLTLKRREASASWIWALVVLNRAALAIGLLGLGGLFLSLWLGKTN